MRRLLLAAALVLAGCGGTTSGASDDAGASLACRHFRNVARDAADGILTGEELRSKLAEVERDARGSEDAAISRTARELLAAFTSGGDQAAAIAAFGDACRALGL